MKSAWQWGATGKHPVVKDYIRIGQATPMLDMFARWVEEGYHSVPADTVQRSWRFFAKGAGRDELACGLVRDSRDGVGRAFPLLILGTGPLADGEQRWEAMALACDTAWERMEYLATKRVFDLNELKGALARLPAPAWPAQMSTVAPAPEIPPLEDGSLSITLHGHTQTEARLMRLKQTNPIPPAAVFIGGLVEEPRMVVFTRPLNTADFERLWKAA